jgi:hypothetical protein
VFLFAVQVLLLPINHGVLVSAGGQALPRVKSLDGVTPLAEDTAAWLIWEGRDGITYLVEGPASARERRVLVTLPKAKVTKTEILGYDHLLKRLFGAPARCKPRNALLTEGER